MQSGITKFIKDGATFADANAAWADLLSQMPTGWADGINAAVAKLQSDGVVTEYTLTWDPDTYTLTRSRKWNNHQAIFDAYLAEGVDLAQVNTYYELAGWVGELYEIADI